MAMTEHMRRSEYQESLARRREIIQAGHAGLPEMSSSQRGFLETLSLFALMFSWLISHFRAYPLRVVAMHFECTAIAKQTQYAID